MSLERGAVGGSRRLHAGGRGGRCGSSARVSVEDVHVRDAASVVVLVQLRQQRGAPRLQLCVAPRARPRPAAHPQRVLTQFRTGNDPCGMLILTSPCPFSLFYPSSSSCARVRGRLRGCRARCASTSCSCAAWWVRRPLCRPPRGSATSKSTGSWLVRNLM